MLLITGLPALQQGQKTTGAAVFVGLNRKPQICRSCEKVLALTCFFKNWWVLLLNFVWKLVIDKTRKDEYFWTFSICTIFSLMANCLVSIRIHQTNLNNSCETENYLACIPFCEWCVEDVNHNILQIRPSLINAQKHAKGKDYSTCKVHGNWRGYVIN